LQLAREGKNKRPQSPALAFTLLFTLIVGLLNVVIEVVDIIWKSCQLVEIGVGVALMLVV
jgi:hypothetical protein